MFFSFILFFINCSKNSTKPEESKVYQIVYESWGHNLYQIKSVNTNGENKEVLVDTLYCKYPRFSTDAYNLLYLAGVPADLFILNLNSSSILKLTDTESYERLPAYSPDGILIAYLQDYDLYLINSDGSNKRFLCEVGQDYSSHQFSPDGQSIVYTKNQNLWLINIDGTNNRMLHESTSGTTHYPIYNPLFSPDGQKIYFEEARVYAGQTMQIFVIDIDGTNKKQLTDTSTNQNFRLNNDGIKIVFCTDRDGNNEIYIMNADGSNQKNLSQSSSHEENPSFSPGGECITFVAKASSIHNGDIYIMNTDGTQKMNISQEPEYDNRRPIFRPVL
jgi:Tol biopolymer transport system component